MNLSDITTQASKVREAEAFLILERERLYALIRRARVQGYKLVPIAEAAGMTRQRVAQVLDREA
jgi:hypothetical protein